MLACNALHAPIGAYASFTLGALGGRGGFGPESGHPPRQDVLVGFRDADGIERALPFFAPDGATRAIDPAAVTRELDATRDAWRGPGVELEIVSPARPVPEPAGASAAELRDALLPAVLLRLTVDNRDGATARLAFFAVRGPFQAAASAGGFVLDAGAGRTAGAFAADAEAVAAAGLATALGGPPGGVGTVGALRFRVPAGERRTYRIVAAFWHAGSVASGFGLSCRFWYTRLFDGLEDVARHALADFDRLAAAWRADAARLDAPQLSEDQRFQLAHATRTYYGNTALLATADDRPLWAVMEGEFGFVNTLDLTVDQLFHELRWNPWTVRNELDAFADRHRYADRLGVSFAHDMGCWPTFAQPGRSAYEQPRRPGRVVCMTGEELTNWTLAALAYVAQTGDAGWAAARAPLLEECLASLVARDAADPAARDGVQGLASDRRGPEGEEVTTYDALDPALEQATRSAYLAGKQWAAYACLAEFLASRGRPAAAATAARQAHLTAATLTASAGRGGRLPARVAADGQPADPVATIPVVEGLAYALHAGAPAAVREDGPYGPYVSALARHLAAVLETGTCLFADGGWKLSSGHDNSWLSKIYLAQYVARRILGLPWDAAGRRADAAHAGWLTEPELGTWAFSDQILAGRIHSSKHYPRGVTAALWLEEHAGTACLKPRP